MDFLNPDESKDSNPFLDEGSEYVVIKKHKKGSHRE
jgi:hypothetical protein